MEVRGVPISDVHHSRLAPSTTSLVSRKLEKRRKKKTLQVQMLSIWHTKAAVHMGVRECHSRSHSGVGQGDTEGLMTERVPEQEMKHPLSARTNDVRISPVLSGLRMAHKMFYSRHPALKK